MKAITKILIITFILGLVMVIISVYNGLTFEAVKTFFNDDEKYGEQLFYSEEAEVQTIVLDIVDRSVFITQGTDDFVAFNYYAHEDDTWTVTEVNGILTIRQEKSRNILDWITIDYKFYTRTLKNLYITLPATRDVNLDLTSHVGSINIEQNDNYFDSISINLSTGNLNLSNVFVDELDLHLGTGNMLLTDVVVDGNFNAINHTGSVKLEGGVYPSIDISNDTGNVTLSDLDAVELQLSTKTGNITTNNLDIENEIKASSGTGKVDLNDTLASGYDLSTKTGDVILEFDTLVSLKYDLSTSTGRITINGTTQGSPYSTQTGNILIKVRVSTGTIRITTQ